MTHVHNPDAVEASKYRDRYHAEHCALVGPSYTEATQLASELQTHGVSAWTVDDLRTLLFTPGFACDPLQTLVWDRRHGRAKGIAIICEYLREAGWIAQVAATRQGPPENAPDLDEDAAMLLVDQKLATVGSTASCSREDVCVAFEYMTNPLTATAMWNDPAQRDAIVILSPFA